MIKNFEERIAALEDHISKLEDYIDNSIKKTISGAYTVNTQPQTLFGLQLGLCVSTVDPLKQNRVRFFHPGLHAPDTKMEALPFAFPISAGFPSFDDSGITWVPPAGTTITLTFVHGNVDAPFYFGSIWIRDRGSPPSWAFPVKEYEDIWAGTRTGYLVGADDETQVFPPWNTWNYNGFDVDSEVDFESDPEASKRTTYPHIMGIKTPEKAGVRWHDGDRKCNLRWKHTEFFSSRGNFILMKDDHLHPSGQWANPQCGCGGGDASICATPGQDGQLMQESASCCKCGDEDCPGGPSCPNDPAGGAKCANKYFKRQDECRTYAGPPTPLNPKPSLPQSGIRIQSIAGHHMEFDDSVDQPTGVPTWDQPFGFGCTDKFLGKLWIMSATGHSFMMNDNEDDTENRSQKNLIKIESACGNSIELNDHTVNKKTSGSERGIKIQNTCLHVLHMVDKDNEQVSPARKNGGVPKAKSKNAYILLRSGYGIHLHISDFHDQEKADEQYLQLMAPQIGNDERGSHFLHMQVRPQGPGVILLRAGGILWHSSYDHSVETVGEGTNIAHKFIDITGMFVSHCDDIYINSNKNTVFKAEKVIILGAGSDCPLPGNSPEVQQTAANSTGSALANISSVISGGGNAVSTGPCIYPVIVAKKPWACPFTKFVHFGMESMSDRVFASATK